MEVLQSHGYRIQARNLRLEAGEVDLLATRGGSPVIVEVKTVIDRGEHPLARIDDDKAERLWRLSQSCGAHGVLLVGVRLGSTAVRVLCLPG